MKRYGIRITMPPDDPMRASHLLGEGWESFRWYDTVEEREAALQGMQQLPPYYRAGDTPSERLSKVER